ncbi:MAG: hypothetical protein IT579_01130 [Verrucomicrobia subdivision 3 bacterium]|nr:hypothetical protein [Limisphaerales bacterium]
MQTKHHRRAIGLHWNSNAWRMAKWFGCTLMLFVLNGHRVTAAPDDLQVSVYCTAGEVQQILATPDGKERVLRAVQPLKVSRLFLEGRRGDEYVPPVQLRELRDFFAAQGIQCSGGIATVPGEKFGVRQTGGLAWLNWESPKTPGDVAEFFRQNAPIFDQIIVDDFFCTGDVSPESERARGGRSWGDYRQDLLVSLIEPMIVQPTLAANPRTQLILKFPQWYDRFHLFGYDPARMPERFEQVWVGTEVRDPNTPRWGYLQPTEGYMNFRWLSSVAGKKVRGAWFDHIECSAQNFVDQAYESVLAGARDLTLFHLGDLLTPHPGDKLLAERMPELQKLADRLRGKTPRGIAFYKPPGAESAENMYLADYLGMIGLPILPVAQYPKEAKVAFLPVQAAGDGQLLDQMHRHLKRGATLVVTPALLRTLGPAAAKLAGVSVGANCEPATAEAVDIAGNTTTLDAPLELDAAMQADAGEVLMTAALPDRKVPFLTRKAVGRGELLVLNVRTFSEQDFRDTGEWLLAPKRRGLPTVPQTLADAIRARLLPPLRVDFQSPSGVQLVLYGKEAWVYSFCDDSVRVRFGRRAFELPAHQLVWLP